MNDGELVSLPEALEHFVLAAQTQDQLHIKLLHRHIVQRLVIEGGFRPDDILPRPGLRVESAGRGGSVRHRLIHDPSLAISGEQTILGGLKTKNVDIVVANREVGPSLLISVKGTFHAFRNLTNRMEEAAGDCTNIHMAYPAIVYGFLHVLRANVEGFARSRNDIAIYANGQIANGIQRYHDAMARLAGRRDLRNDVSRYEAVGMILARTEEGRRGDIATEFPPADSLLDFGRFFGTLFATYDLRFVFSAPSLAYRTRRLIWSQDSPIIADAEHAGFLPRTG
jgi:hypothetical protein